MDHLKGSPFSMLAYPTCCRVYNIFLHHLYIRISYLYCTKCYRFYARKKKSPRLDHPGESPASCGGQVKTFCSPDFKAASSVWKRSIHDSPETVWHKRLVETGEARCGLECASHREIGKSYDMGVSHRFRTPS
jgi:hypothetical protein